MLVNKIESLLNLLPQDVLEENKERIERALDVLSGKKSKFEVGDSVCHYLVGTVTEVDENMIFGVSVKFMATNTQVTFTHDGKLWDTDEEQSLWHTQDFIEKFS
jgi:hypothetical protein